ncbi:MAG: hypothetical protein J5738_06045 [Lachnospiraceae bacterium]|nr:hypothetical protein [Lachnospiraceae bacterium]
MEEDQNRIEESVIDESIIHENGTAENEDEEFGKKAFAIFAIFLVFLFILVLLNPDGFKNLFKRKDKDKRKKDRFVLSADQVALDTPEEIRKTMEDRYGKAVLLSSQEIGTGRERHVECFLRDVEHDFPFRAWSSPSSISIDGATFGYKGTVIGDNYVECYTNWISIQLRPILEEHGIELRDSIDKNSWSARSLGRAYSFRDNVLVSPEDLWYDDKAFVLSTIRTFNPPRAIEERLSEVVVIKTGKSIKDPPTEEETAKEMFNFLRVQFKIEAEYIRREATTAGDVPGLLDQVFYEVEVKEEVTENTPLFRYYFRYEDKEFYVCDIKVRVIDSRGNGNIYYYQNYQTMSPDIYYPHGPGGGDDSANVSAGGGAYPENESPGGAAGYDASDGNQNDSTNE